MSDGAPETISVATWAERARVHLGAGSLRIVTVASQADVLASLRRSGALIPLSKSAYPDSDLLLVPPEPRIDVEPTRFVTSSNAADAGPLHRWMSAAWVDKRFRRALAGASTGRELWVLPLRTRALGRAIPTVVVTEVPSLVATLLRLVELDDDVLSAPAGTEVARCLVTEGGRSRGERFVCLAVDDLELWSSGWYSGPTAIVEETLGIAFPSLLERAPDAGCAASGTVSLFNARGRAPRTVAFVGGGWDARLAASWSSSSERGGTSSLMSDGPTWFASGDGSLRCGTPFLGCRLPLRSLRLPEAAPVLARLRSSLLFSNAARSAQGIPWWDERGDAPTSPEVICWDGMSARPSPARRGSHTDATVIVPYALLQGDQASRLSAGLHVDAVVFVIDVAEPVSVLLEPASFSQAVAVALGFDALTGHLHDPLGLRAFPGDVATGLQRWLSLGERVGVRAFVWTVPRFSSGRGEQLAAREIASLIAAALDGNKAALSSPLGAVHAVAPYGRPAESVRVFDALSRAVEELGSRCPPALRRAHGSLISGADSAVNS
ncbi:MAG: hypothetical protein HYS27_10735 [Deltaproteobacteria bacterium]|nr:hypothetical protein [Deltaproteobacteria bacterium]